MSLTYEVNTQSSIRVSDGTSVLYFDPLELSAEPHDADIILITHDHYDHYSAEDIRKAAKKDTYLVLPQSMKTQAQTLEPLFLPEHIVLVSPGQSLNVEGVAVETVPAYNVFKTFHPKKKGYVGYVITLDGTRVYVTGDMDATPESRKVRCQTILLPIGGKFTMNAREAAQLVNIIHPKLAIPTHYGSIVGSKADADTFRSYVDSSITVETRL